VVLAEPQALQMVALAEPEQMAQAVAVAAAALAQEPAA